MKCEDEERIGHTVSAKIQKNKVGAPFRQAEYQIKYEEGVVNTREEVFSLAIDYGLITRPSTQSYGIAGEQIRGKDAAKAYFLENNLEEEFLSRIKDAYINGVAINNVSDNSKEESAEENSLIGMIE